MLHVNRIERREILNGWIKWAVLPLIPFSVLFFDAWLNVQIRYKDYELGRLNYEQRQLDAQLDLTRAREAKLSGVEHLTHMAETLQLAAPTVHQFQEVAYRETERRIVPMTTAATEITVASTGAIELDSGPMVTVARNTGMAPPTPYKGDHEEAHYLMPVTPPPELYVEMVGAGPLPAPVDSELSFLSVEDMLGKL